MKFKFLGYFSSNEKKFLIKKSNSGNLVTDSIYKELKYICLWREGQL